MKTIKKIIFFLSLAITFNRTSAQNNDDARALIKEGVQFSSSKKYTEAIEKYNQALKIDTGNFFGAYQLALALFNLERGKEGIPYLEKVIKGDTSLKAAAYDLLGFIRFRAKQYNEAEQCAVEALKINPKAAGTQRMYALVAFHQNKRAAALLGFCSFILLDPNSARSAEAFGNIQHILAGGALKPEPGVTIPPLDADNLALNQAITKAIMEAGKEKYNSPADLLAAQLKNIFIGFGQLAEKQTGNDFFRDFMAAYFYKLAQSPNMAAFARLVSLSLPESWEWAKKHAQEISELDNWVKGTERGYEKRRYH